MNPSSGLSAFDPAGDVRRAAGRIRGDVLRTALEYSDPLSRRTGTRVFVKWECDQTTGSFKIRGALNKIRSLSASDKRAGILTASTGNHGLGVVRAAALEKTAAVVFLPRTAAPGKIARLRDAGAVLRFHGPSCETAEAAARRDASRRGKVYVSPYNDLAVIAGQGTIGLEILEDCPEAAEIIVPIGGGGLISGIAGYVKSIRPAVRILGVEPSASAFMKASIAAGRIVTVEEGRTSADAVAGGIEAGSITFPLCRRFVDEIRTVGEARLREAVVLYHRLHGRIVEGAGALSLAVLLKDAPRFKDRTVVLVVSGGNAAESRLFRGFQNR